MNTTHTELRAGYQPEFDLAALPGIVLKAVGLWRARARQRRELLELSAWQLADIGVSREAARAEAGKPFWQR